MNILKNIIYNHILDEVTALRNGDNDLADHIKDQYDMYLGHALKREGMKAVRDYDDRRRHYIYFVGMKR